MRMKAAAIALAATTALATGAVFAQPVLAQEQERTERMQERLEELLQEGVITEERAQDVRDHMADQIARREEKRAAHDALAQEIADTLGITVDELTDARKAGTSLAELAESAGVDVQILIDQLVTEATNQVNEALAEGKIDQGQAAARIDAITAQITARVNGEVPEGIGNHLDRGPRRAFGPRHGFGGERPDGFEPGDFANRFGGERPDGFPFARPGRFGPGPDSEG